MKFSIQTLSQSSCSLVSGQLSFNARMVACTDEERRGLQLCVANTLLGSVLGICSKFAANGGVPFFQLVLVRSLTLVLGTIPGLIAARINPFAHHER